jgi:hypothetical protein
MGSTSKSGKILRKDTKDFIESYFAAEIAELAKALNNTDTKKNSW